MSICRHCKHLLIVEYWRGPPMYTCAMTYEDIPAADVDKDFRRPKNCTYFRRAD